MIADPMRRATSLAGAFLALSMAQMPLTRALLAQDAPPRVDYLTFAQGAVPVAIRGAGAEKGANYEHAVRIVDGDATGFTVVERADSSTATEFIYELPAPTTFDRFAVPRVTETPSPSQTFTGRVEVFGSAAGPDGEWVLLASGTLATHRTRDEVTELTLTGPVPVRWVRVRLVGGIVMSRPEMFLEFGEIIGNGTQDAPALADHFRGVWRDRGVRLELRQEGPTVTGCYDGAAPLEGTVSGNILRASGTNPSDGVVSHFILSVAADGAVRGVRSTNAGPFRFYAGAAAPAGTALACPELPPPTLGCGSVIQGIRFGYDSADLPPGSEAILEDLFDGLRNDPSASILIEGHTSSEGAEAYNQALSERRAGAVSADLARRGIAAARLSSAGAGESRPVASNDDESGRSLNRRVEVSCQG